MLTLTRRPGEAINIGDDVEVEIVSIRGSNVRLRVSAPKQTAIFRSELIRGIVSGIERPEGTA